MRALAYGSVIFAIGCNGGHPGAGANPGGGDGQTLPDGGRQTVPDGGQPPPDGGGIADAAAPAADAAVAKVAASAIVFSAALDGQAAPDVYVLDGGKVTRLTNTAGGEMYPTISPDRTRIAFMRGLQVFVIDASGRNERLVAAKAGRVRYAVNGSPGLMTQGPSAWSPDGTQLAYPYPNDPMPRTDPSDPVHESYATTLHIINADGTNDRLVSPELKNWGTVNSIGWWGDTVSFTFDPDCPDCAGTAVYGFIKADGTGLTALCVLWNGCSGDSYPATHLDWSPDGSRWTYTNPSRNFHAYEGPGIVYTSTAYVADAQPLVTTTTAWNPRWSSDGTQIAYIDADGIYVIAASGGTSRRVLAVTGVHGIDW